MSDLSGIGRGDRGRALWLSTIAFTVCFAVWTIFSIIGVQIKDDLGLSEAQFGLLVGTPILTGSLIRLFLGVWTDQYGGRIVYTAVMLSAAVATWLLTFAYDYPTFLMAALGVGIAGGSFAVGVAYVAKWYPTDEQGTALGIFGAGNVGAALTKFVAPFIMVAYGWQAVAQPLGAGDRRDGGRLLVLHQGRAAARSSAQSWPEAGVDAGHARAARAAAGLAFLALLFLPLRRVRCACPVAAPLPDRGLWAGYRHCRHNRGLLLCRRHPFSASTAAISPTSMAPGGSCTGLSAFP